MKIFQEPMKIIELGSATVQRIVELDRWGFAPADLFPEIEPELVEEAGRRWGPRFVDARTNELILSVQSYVVRTSNRVILIDSCNGNYKPRPALPAHHMLETEYLARLQQGGVAPADVDLVLCTHLHPDHIGWNTQLVDGSWVPTFPNARYLVGRTDYLWLEEIHRSRPPEGIPADLAAMFEDSVLPVVRSGQVDLVAEDHAVARELDHNIWLEPAPGHTGGHMIVHVETSGGHAVVTGDVLHHPLQLDQLELRMAGDGDPTQAAMTRRNLVETYADTATILLPGHFPTPTAGRLVERNGSLDLAWI